MVEFTEAIKMFYANYTKFDGRSRRSEYWWVQLYIFFAVIIFGVLAILLSGGVENIDSGRTPPGLMLVGGLFVAFILANILPGIALQIRRFHDLGQTGWLVLVFAVLGAIPGIGVITAIWQIIWFCIRGTVGPNKFGDDPLGDDTIGVAQY